jgi:phosphoglycolate phosphatase
MSDRAVGRGTDRLRFDGVVFDLDGTLADTLEDLAAAVNRMLACEGLPPHGEAAYKEMIGKGIRNLVTVALPAERRTEETIDRCLERMMADYHEHCLVKTHLYDGIADLLRELRVGGVKLAVFSNKADELTRRIVVTLTDPGTFDVVVGARPGLPLKPDPAAALLIGARLGVAPSRMVYLGDSGTDMLTANAAGMVAVGVSWGFRSRDELVENGATVVLDHPLELLALRAASDR